MNNRSTTTVGQSLDRLRSLELAGLRQEWQRCYGSPAPKLSRDLLILGLGYHVQEQQFGGLTRATQLALRTSASSFRTTGKVQAAPVPLKPGARLLREWQGRTHIVTVVAGGFEHDGAIYKSLSTIAKTITGAHWSGPRFFGLLKPSKRTAQTSAHRG